MRRTMAIIILALCLSSCTEIIVKNCRDTNVLVIIDDTDDVKPNTALTLPVMP